MDDRESKFFQPSNPAKQIPLQSGMPGKINHAVEGNIECLQDHFMTKGIERAGQ